MVESGVAVRYPSRLHRAAKVQAFIEFCLEVIARNARDTLRVSPRQPYAT
jgi:hypothetical protein